MTDGEFTEVLENSGDLESSGKQVFVGLQEKSCIFVAKKFQTYILLSFSSYLIHKHMLSAYLVDSLKLFEVSRLKTDP